MDGCDGVETFDGVSYFTRSQRHIVPSSQTERRMLPSRLNAVCRIAVEHLLFIRTVHLRKNGKKKHFVGE
uniref:Uncharacterized protein n=1 Tax=Octopus bimaculoides TaxID=37653 RepID=A0A0L8FHG4_OCTBM